MAGRLGIPRSSVARIESGKRSVSGLELERMAHLYGRDMRDFFAETFSGEDTVAGFLCRALPDGLASDDPPSRGPPDGLARYAPPSPALPDGLASDDPPSPTFADGLARDDPLRPALRDGQALVQAIADIEEALGLDRDAASGVRYPRPRPKTEREAVWQGESVAHEERKRLALGENPLPDLVELLGAQGVLVVARELPMDLSRLTLDLPPVILVNSDQSPTGMRFVCALEYAHVLLGWEEPGGPGWKEDYEDLTEVRANAFVASFLMPPEGVASFMRRLAKGWNSREGIDPYGESPATVTRAEGSPPPRSQEVQIYDVALLAHHFGVSRTAAIDRLQSLGIIRAKDLERLLQRETKDGSRVAEALGLEPANGPAPEALGRRFLCLGIEALRREKISRRKLTELAALLGTSDETLERILVAVGLERPPVDVTPSSP